MNKVRMNLLFIILIILSVSIKLFGQHNESNDFDKNVFSEQLQFSTLKIQVYSRNTKTPTKIDTASGTSFVFSFAIDSLRRFPILVTNNHVVSNAFAYSIFLTRRDEKGNPLIGKIDTLTFTNKEFQWSPHANSKIDLCAIPLIPILRELSKSKYGYFVHSITEDDIPTKEELADFKGIEDVYMIGYPIGMWDFKNNLPIVRKGITATHPFMNYQNSPIFLIDAACFPGSSGSPVLIINEGAYTTKTSTRMGRRRLFLGILFGGPTYNPDGTLKIVDIPTTKKDTVFIQNVPINLGYCIKSSEILSFKRNFRL